MSIHIHTCKHMHVSMHVYIFICLCICMYIYMCVRLCVCVCINSAWQETIKGENKFYLKERKETHHQMMAGVREKNEWFWLFKRSNTSALNLVSIVVWQMASPFSRVSLQPFSKPGELQCLHQEYFKILQKYHLFWEVSPHPVICVKCLSGPLSQPSGPANLIRGLISPPSAVPSPPLWAQWGQHLCIFSTVSGIE